MKKILEAQHHINVYNEDELREEEAFKKGNRYPISGETKDTYLTIGDNKQSFEFSKNPKHEDFYGLDFKLVEVTES